MSAQSFSVEFQAGRQPFSVEFQRLVLVFQTMSHTLVHLHNLKWQIRNTFIHFSDVPLQRSNSAPGFLQAQYRQIQVDVSAAQEENDGIDAAAVQYVARLISARTKKLKKLDWQAHARKRKRLKKDASNLIAAITSRIIEALALQERHACKTKLTKALHEKVEKKAQRWKVDFFSQASVQMAQESLRGSSAAVEAIMNVYFEATQSSHGQRDAAQPDLKMKSSETPKQRAQEVGSSAAVEAIMNVYYKANGSVHRHKDAAQPDLIMKRFPRSNLEFEADLIDWMPELDSEAEWNDSDDGEWTQCCHCGHHVLSHWDYCNACGRLR